MSFCIHFLHLYFPRSSCVITFINLIILNYYFPDNSYLKKLKIKHENNITCAAITSPAETHIEKEFALDSGEFVKVSKLTINIIQVM